MGIRSDDRWVGVTLICLQNSIALFRISVNLRDKKCSDSLGFCGKQQSEVSENHGCTEGRTIRLIDAWTARGCKVLTLKEVFFIFISVVTEGVKKQQWGKALLFQVCAFSFIPSVVF